MRLHLVNVTSWGVVVAWFSDLTWFPMVLCFGYIRGETHPIQLKKNWILPCYCVTMLPKSSMLLCYYVTSIKN